MRGWWMVAVLAGGVLCGVTGCRQNSAEKQARGMANGAREGGPILRQRSAPVDEATLGMVSGTVRFAGKAPAPVKIDMSMDPACSMTGGANDSEQYVVKDGRLANVYVYVKSGPTAAMGAVEPEPGPVVLDQVGCRYVPHVIAVVQGGRVEFRNSDGTMHNIHTMPTVVGNETIDISQGPKGGPVTKRFARPEVMMPVRCNNHPWMNAFLNVAPNPFFAVTNAEGSYSIRGLPPGIYTLAAVHEKLGEQDVQVTVPAHGTTTSDLSFTMH